MKDIKIIVATHKKYEMPQNKIYLPVQVGAEGKEDLGYVKDNTGENISIKNPYFCELTGLYWAWKNLKHSYIGLAHYRRHFSTARKKGKNKEDIEIEANRSEKDISDNVELKTPQENSLPVWDLSLYKDTPQVNNSISYNHNLKPTQQKPKQNDSIEDDGIEM